MLLALHLSLPLGGFLISAAILLWHALAAIVVILATTTAVFLWRHFMLDVVGDYVRPHVERLRARLGLPTIDQSPTRRERARRSGTDGAPVRGCAVGGLRRGRIDQPTAMSTCDPVGDDRYQGQVGVTGRLAE